MESLYGQMVETAENAGINIVGIERAAQVLAVVYLYGDESAVYSEKMKIDIAYICRKYGVYGTGTPDEAFISKIKKYVGEIRDCWKPQWLRCIEGSYKVIFHEYRNPPKAERR